MSDDIFRANGGVSTFQGTTAPPKWLFGWRDDPAAVQKVLATLPFPRFEMAAPNLAGTGEGKSAFLWEAVQKVYGKHLPAQQQPRGTCVSRGFSRAIDYLQCIEIALLGESEELQLISHAAVYGMAKEIGHDLSNQDGAVGAWAADAVSKWGTVTNEEAGDRDAGYDDLAVLWGRKGCPQNIKDLAKDNLVGAVTLVTKPEQARDAICNGYPVVVCSDQGFSMTRDGEGFCMAKGSWAHCVLPDTMIAGPVYRRASEVSVGDDVYGHDGQAHEVTEVHRRSFRGTLARIKAAGIPAVQFTDEHPVLVYRRARRFHGSHKRAALAVGTSIAPTDTATHYAATQRFEPAWVKAKDVRPGDRLLTPQLKTTVPVSPEWVRDGAPQTIRHLNPIRPCDELAWLFGFYVGDGNATPAHKVSLTLSLSDSVERVLEAFRLLGVEPAIERHETFVRVHAYSAVLADSFIEWFGSGSENKRVPAWLMTWDADAVLCGLIQADGCDYKGRRIYTTVSPILAEQVRLLVVAGGERPAVTLKQPGKGAYANGRTQHVIQWHPGSTDRKVSNAAGFAMYVVQSVMLIPYEGEVFNYEVADVHSYVADGVVTHNCMFWSAYDDEKKRFCIEQSWGQNVPDGPLYKGQPDNSFWASWETGARMLRQNDSFAVAKFAGWPARTLSWLI